MIDDHSTDGTAEVVWKWQEEIPFSLRYLRNEGAGKKAALLTGIRTYQCEVIVTLDADTVPEPGALEALVRPFRRASVQMSAAYVRFWDGKAYKRGGPGKRFLLAFQALEMTGFLALTAGSWQRGEPITVNGAFLAYRKQAFEAVGGWGNAPHPADITPSHREPPISYTLFPLTKGGEGMGSTESFFKIRFWACPSLRSGRAAPGFAKLRLAPLYEARPPLRGALRIPHVVRTQTHPHQGPLSPISATHRKGCSFIFRDLTLISPFSLGRGDRE